MIVIELLLKIISNFPFMIESILNQYKEATSFEIILEVLVLYLAFLVDFAKKKNILFILPDYVATVITVYLLKQTKYFGD
jgi:hypothetical protein